MSRVERIVRSNRRVPSVGSGVRAASAVKTTPPTSEVSLRMSRVGQRDTAPELALRRELHGLGLRYRVDRKVLPNVRRRADVVFGHSLVAVFVDGCFWHCCPKHATHPKTNAAWWRVKLRGNVLRDRDTDQRLRAAGWQVLRVWAHEDPIRAARRIERSVLRRSRR